jgi:hypothetical protein
MSLAKSDLESIVRACSFILKGEEERLLGLAVQIPVKKLSCYLSKLIQGEIVTSLKEVQSSKEKEIILVGVTVKYGEIEIDTYGKERIRFCNCNFENVSSITAKKTRVAFESCHFRDCVRELESQNNIDTEYERVKACFEGKELDYSINAIAYNAVICLNEAAFCNCEFERCGQSYGAFSGGLLSCQRGSIEKCIFKDCFVKVYTMFWDKKYPYVFHQYAALLLLRNFSVSACQFLNCKISGDVSSIICSGNFLMNQNQSPNFQGLSLIYGKDGKVMDSLFSECVISENSGGTGNKFNYLIYGIGVLTNRNHFTQCTALTEGKAHKWEVEE